jgi:UDP-2-acetamido-3-amino-2,3-dideoxy-glucuronate N-acetyltransferase
MSFFAHPTAVIDEGCQIGDGTKVWHFSHVMPGAVIGKNCVLGQNVMIGPNVILGDNVRIQNNVSVYEGVICEDDVFLGPSAVLTNVINPRSAIIRKAEFKSTIIRKGATIGANATIVCGNEIGAFSFIGAGAVVKKSVKSYALMIVTTAIQKAWMG